METMYRKLARYDRNHGTYMVFTDQRGETFHISGRTMLAGGPWAFDEWAWLEYRLTPSSGLWYVVEHAEAPGTTGVV